MPPRPLVNGHLSRQAIRRYANPVGASTPRAPWDRARSTWRRTPAIPVAPIAKNMPRCHCRSAHFSLFYLSACANEHWLPLATRAPSVSSGQLQRRAYLDLARRSLCPQVTEYPVDPCSASESAQRGPLAPQTRFCGWARGQHQDASGHPGQFQARDHGMVPPRHRQGYSGRNGGTSLTPG